MIPRLNPATLAAAASVLAQAMPEYGDPQRLLAALRLADQAKAEAGNAIPGPHLLTLKECASRLTTCKRTVQNLIAAGQLPARKMGSRFVRVLESDLLAFIDGMPMRPTTHAGGSVSAKRDQ